MKDTFNVVDGVKESVDRVMEAHGNRESTQFDVNTPYRVPEFNERYEKEVKVRVGYGFDVDKKRVGGAAVSSATAAVAALEGVQSASVEALVGSAGLVGVAAYLAKDAVSPIESQAATQIIDDTEVSETPVNSRLEIEYEPTSAEYYL